MSTSETSPSPDDPNRMPLVSQFAQDADMAELVEYFVVELSRRIEAIGQAWASDDQHHLRRLARQLKGAAAGYGFPQITDAAALLESSLLAEEAELANVHERVESLIELCRRATSSQSKQ